MQVFLILIHFVLLRHYLLSHNDEGLYKYNTYMLYHGESFHLVGFFMYMVFSVVLVRKKVRLVVVWSLALFNNNYCFSYSFEIVNSYF